MTEIKTAEQRAAEQERESLKAVQEAEQETERRMGADEYVVVAPYVTLRVRDNSGAYVVVGYHEGAVVKAENIDGANLRHHVETRLLVPKGHEDAEFAAPAGTPKPGEPPNVPVEESGIPATLPPDERLRRQREAADRARQADQGGSRRQARSSQGKAES